MGEILGLGATHYPSLTAPPEGDVTLAEARAAWPEKLFWSNINAETYELPPERKQELRDRWKQFSPEERERLKERWRNVTPEQRDALLQQVGGGGAQGGAKRPRDSDARGERRIARRQQQRLVDLVGGLVEVVILLGHPRGKVAAIERDHRRGGAALLLRL